MSDIGKKIEALLFVAGSPQTIEKLSKILKTEKEDVQKGLEELEESLSDRGVRLSKNGNEYMLLTAPDFSGTVQDYMKEDLGESISRASLETLSVIVYKGPLSRSEIDYIRGVSSGFSVRNLMIRGLIERTADPKDSRSWLYTPSFDFLKYMGIEKIQKLPGYEDFAREVQGLLARDKKEEEI